MPASRRIAAIVLSLLVVAAGAGGCGGGHTVSQAALGSVHPPGWGSTPKGFVPPPGLPRSTPTGVMFDAVTLSNIPSNPFAVAGYIAGNWPTWFHLAADFPRAHRISIAIHRGQHAMCGDFEPGDMTSADAGPWASEDIKAGFSRPCLYGSLSNMPAIFSSLRAWLGAGWRSRVLLWLAWYRFIPGLVAGYDAVQWTDNAYGRNLDENTVTLDFLRIAQPPYVPPKPPPVLPVCFHKRETASACQAVKAKVASQQRAAASSQRALAATNRVLAANRCRTPYRRGVCVHKGHDARVFGQRARFFTNAAAKLEAAN